MFSRAGRKRGHHCSRRRLTWRIEMVLSLRHDWRSLLMASAEGREFLISSVVMSELGVECVGEVGDGLYRRMPCLRVFMFVRLT